MADLQYLMSSKTGSQTVAKPFHIQRLEAHLDMTTFLKNAQNVLSLPLTSDDDSDSDVNIEQLAHGDRVMNGVVLSKNDRQAGKIHIYNLAQVGSDRKWLQDLLLSDTETESEISDEDEYIRDMLKEHVRGQKLRTKYYTNSNYAQYGYYGAGLLSNVDHFNEHQRSIVGNKKRIRKERPEKALKTKTRKYQRQPKYPHETGDNDIELGDVDLSESQRLPSKDEIDDGLDSRPGSPLTPKSRRMRKKEALAKTPEVMAARRRKVWQLMAKKELGKVQRAKVNNHKEVLTGCKRVASFCMRIFRQRAMQSQKNMKETVWRAKRLTREMQGYWKRYDRVERETRRRMEKEAEEQRKMDVELIEAKRQQRKLNFLITQTELYAHFMSKKLGHGTEEEQLRILNQLDEEANPRLAAIDDYNSELLKQKAQKNASEAFYSERRRTKEFDSVAAYKMSTIDPIAGASEIKELPQPSIFKGVLKGYQIKGMTWLANLYNQGISGILADEMGLGKTVQSIAFLCHIAEHYGLWGPFLIISPASTLHNWQQEMQRFVPEFNVVPYWGSPNERKILRQFWEQKDLHTRDASFHVVITSYQLIVSDYKYFNRIKWQYMVLDEAQAIKSSSSVRWKLLLGFNCRNRLLLSGTPIQNSMAELWALLHFIMPTLFDSHDEFNEWFSKDIESHAENKTGIDERQISRLHMILKPFMLRRIKKDVENELSDKIEIMVYCPLTMRQKLLYMALKKKIRVEDLLQYTGAASTGDSHGHDKNITSNLMNLVMQFRKVCNHPELFERRDTKSPLYMKTDDYHLPKLIFDEALLYRLLPSRIHLLYNKFSIFKAENIHRSLFPKHHQDKNIEYSRYIDLNVNGSTFSFSRFCGPLSPGDIENITLGGLICLIRWNNLHRDYLRRLYYRYHWLLKRDSKLSLATMLLEPTVESIQNSLFYSQDYNSGLMSDLIFTEQVSSHPIYTFTQHIIHSMDETVEHRLIRKKHYLKEREMFAMADNDLINETYISEMKHNKGLTIPEHYHIPRPSRRVQCQPTVMPGFLYGIGPKVVCNGRSQHFSSRAAQWMVIRHDQCENEEGRRLIFGGLQMCRPRLGWSNITIPDKQTLISDAGKLFVLDGLLLRLKAQGHRVLIYSQMTKVIDLLEEYMWHRKYKYMRLDGSSKISARRDMVADFQTRADIFVFLLSTRAGGLGINLTAADTVIFYDSDWNPTVDQQAMDRAHRLGQTKQVTVYRLVCKGTIEERILQRAREKSEIQRMVISGGNFKPDTLKPKEVVSLLLDDEEIELKYRQKTEERRSGDESIFGMVGNKDRDRKRKPTQTNSTNYISSDIKRLRSVEPVAIGANQLEPHELALFEPSGVCSPAGSETSDSGMPSTSTTTINVETGGNDDSSNEALVVDCDSPSDSSTPVSFNFDGVSKRRRNPRGTKRGRPRGIRRGGGSSCVGRSTASNTNVPGSVTQASTSATIGEQPSDHISFRQQTTSSPIHAKRGPGRPRLKHTGPSNQGFRVSGPSVTRVRKPIGPLLVPLGSSPTATPKQRSPVMSPAPSPAPPTNVSQGTTIFYQQLDEEVKVKIE